MADILDKRPLNDEMTIFKTEVEPYKLNACIDNILMRVDRLETKFADVQPIKHGWWTYPYKDKDINQCSECRSCVQDKISNVREMFAYCPFCGARMDGDVK